MGEVFEFLARGGVLMIPIFLGSIIALAIFLERIWSLQNSRIVPAGLADQVISAVKSGKITQAREDCLKNNTPLARVLLAGIDHAKRTPAELRTALEDIGRRELARMERFIEAMGTTASVEPLLGLLGTVIGMIRVFRQVVTASRQGAVDPGMLANGIWQALITTAAGLAVAIVAFVGYRFLLSRTSQHAFVLEESASILMESLIGPTDSEPEEAPAE